MKPSIFIILLIIVRSLMSCTPSTEHESNVLQDFSSTEFLLDWFDNGMPESEIEKIASTPGMLLMELNLQTIEKDASLSFAETLRKFRADTSLTDIYGVEKAYANRAGIRKLMNVLKETNFCDSTFAYAAKFMPKGYNPQIKFEAYFVPTGWVHGDAIVRRVQQNGKQFILSNDGKPTSIYNLEIIAQTYGQTPEEQANTLKGVMAHEMFHLQFGSYKQQSEQYAISEKDGYMEALIGLVHNEGIAHYVCYHEQMELDFKAFEVHQRSSFDMLNQALIQLAGSSIDNQTKDSLLFTANTGRFWNKYGAIAGMFMAYHIEHELGFDKLVNTIAMGDSNYFEAYNTACSRNSSLYRVSIVPNKQ